MDLKNDLKEMVKRARAAQPAWQALPLKERVKFFKLLKEDLLENYQQWVKVIQQDTKKVWPEAMIEILYLAQAIDFWQKNAARFLEEKIRPHFLLINKKVKSIWQPKPVVGIIGPWNLPLTLNFGEAVPALIAGCSVILKPSSQTPLTSLFAQSQCQKIGLPENIFQVAVGGGEIGEELIKMVDMVAFCGSVKTGKRVIELCTQRNIPVSAELGGKTPFLILKDADLERAANCLCWNAFANTGHYCKSAERAYVQEEIFSELVEKVVKKTKALKPGIDYGPLIAPFQIEIINDHLKDATNKGAKILTGGKSDGNWFEPTVLIGVNHSMKIMKEESFGPLLPIMSFSSEKEAIELCNDCQLGLNAVIFTKDKKRAERELAPKIEAGVVTINEAMINYLVIGAPQGGVKLSGWGPHRHGREGIQRFCDQKTILIHSFSWPFLNRREIWWFPYTNLTKKAYQLFVKILKFG